MLVTTRGRGSADDFSWGAVRDAPKRLTGHRTVPTTKNVPAQSVHSMEAEKPRVRARR